MIRHTIVIDWRDIHYLRPNWTRQECESAIENLGKEKRDEICFDTVSLMLTSLDNALPKVIGENNVNN